LGKLVKLEEEAKENDFIRKQIDLASSKLPLQNLILANIVGQDSSNLRRYFFD